MATLASYGDREQYHDAIRKVMSYEALRDLRAKLAANIDVEEEPPKPRRRTKRKAG